jgi:ferrous iron transport protein B
MTEEYTIALVGNPNSGKTTLFNALTGAHQKVGNWPGVTVERKTGQFTHSEHRYNVVDLPGTYSLHVSYEDDSVDQQIAQQFVLEESADLIVNIIDASSMERGLYLTTQLLDAGEPMVVALNMMDVADKQGIHIDFYKLSAELGCPVVPIVASRDDGIGTLVDVISSALESEPGQEEDAPGPSVMGEVLEQAMDRITELMNGSALSCSRLRAIAILERDAAVLGQFEEPVRQQLLDIVAQTESKLGADAADKVIAARYKWIGEIAGKAAHHESRERKPLTDYLDSLLLNRFLAFPLFLAVIYTMFMVTMNFGGAFIDFFDGVAGALFVETPRVFLTELALPRWLVTLLTDGVGAGIQLVASFIPIIATLFLFQSFLEDSGYMARVAFILDRLMRSLGLPGKSFVPLIVGFGCNVPAVMATRALDSQQDRLLTTIMAPFMSCGARLTVYALFAAVFFPRNGQNVVFGLYLTGVVLAILSGLIIRRRILNRDVTPLIMELPNYHVPTIKGLLLHTWHKLKGFMLRAGKAIVLVVVVLNFVNSIGTDGSYGNENSERSVLSAIGKTITPLFEPLGVREDNWPATVGIFSGIFAKEVVVGTLDALYTSMADEQNAANEEESFDLWDSIADAAATIPVNLADLVGTWSDPLGMGVGEVADQAQAAEEQEVELSTLGMMASLFDGQLGAFCYILFVLLYMPCVATIAAIYKEMGGFWAVFSASWNTTLAYATAVSCYQVGTFSAHPQTSLLWLTAMLALLIAGYQLLAYFARRQASSSNLIPVTNL